MPTERTVLDTNIVVSAAISAAGAPARVFEEFLRGKITNYTTKDIIQEIEQVLRRKELEIPTN